MGRVAAGVALLLCSFLDLGLSQYEGVTPECVPTDTYVSAKPDGCGPGRLPLRPRAHPSAMMTNWAPPRQLNAVMDVVKQQADMLDSQLSLFERMTGNSTQTLTTSELMMSTDYWQALGVSFADFVRNDRPPPRAAPLCRPAARPARQPGSCLRACAGRRQPAGRVGGQRAHYG